ncbi:MAG TPA: hypothetical protein VF783_01385 [Terriglobales bacterium]
MVRLCISSLGYARYGYIRFVPFRPCQFTPYLLTCHCRADAEDIVIGEWSVQFLPPSGDLEREAIDQALQTEVDGVTAWVTRGVEHLVAIALQTGRAKDHASPRKSGF